MKPWYRSKHYQIGLATMILAGLTAYVQGGNWREGVIAAIGEATVYLGLEKRAAKGYNAWLDDLSKDDLDAMVDKTKFKKVPR